jgi:hypothetical protein
MIREELLATLPRLRRLPDRIDRIITLAARGYLRVRSVIDEDGSRILRTLVNCALLAAVGGTFLVVASMLLMVAGKGPAVSSGTGPFEIFGYGGLLAGSVLCLRVRFYRCQMAPLRRLKGSSTSGRQVEPAKRALEILPHPAQTRTPRETAGRRRKSFARSRPGA